MSLNPEILSHRIIVLLFTVKLVVLTVIFSTLTQTPARAHVQEEAQAQVQTPITASPSIQALTMPGVSENEPNQDPEPPSGYLAGQASDPGESHEPGLLFYLSAEQGSTADFAAGGQVLPNYLNNVNVIPDGAHGQALQAEDDQQLSYWAPGNIYAQRGTLSFFWRSRYPVGPTEFPVFRVGYADHSSWDMIWLRIDYNGSGFDAYVTDVGLTRTRVSHFMDAFPGPDEWTHIVLSWDETKGIRLYINGELAERSSVTGMVYDTGLDQFGPHSRIISPYQVQSGSNRRGGDLDELRIYDRMLSDENIAELARGEQPTAIPELNRNLSERRWRDAWWTRHGWNRPNPAPPVLPSTTARVRKVEIHDAIDIKRWYWKANDGIRETTWPAAYNMSRLPGRFDYYILPDWDSYSISGQTIRFAIPDQEPWNHIEMWGKAWGQLTHESDHPYDHTFAVRNQHQVKSVHRLDEAKEGGTIRFDNALIEEPIGSFMVYHVGEGQAPKGMAQRIFTLQPAPGPEELDSSLDRITAFIQGRYPADERAMMLGVAEGGKSGSSSGGSRTGHDAPPPPSSHPFIHVLIPYEEIPDAGLDGIVLELPGLEVEATHDGVFPLNVRVKDPLWEMRDLVDFSFSVEPGQPQTVWLDSRDRMVPQGRGLYLTIAGAGADLTPEALEGAKVRLVYTSKEQALTEHIIDRFTQLRDLHAHNVEEGPRSPRLNSHNRFYADVHDLLAYDPDHWLTRTYWYWLTRDLADRPEYEIPSAPEGVPEWAHLQIEYLRQLERIAMYYIDERQISNGEFGGGLNDDGKFALFFSALSYFGVEPDKLLESLLLHSTAYFDQERDPYDAPLKQPTLPLFTNGLATIQSDPLHGYEDGIQVVAQLQLLDFANPLHFNRGMETAKRILEDITQINPDGHRLIRSRYYSGTRIAKEDPWQWSVGGNSYILLHTAWMIARHNGNPELQQLIIELADGLLEYYKEDGLYPQIHFSTGEYRGGPATGAAWMMFQAAYDYTGDEKYLEPTEGRVKQSRTFNEENLARQYTEEVKDMGVREYINTEGSIWIDRVTIRSTGWMQEHRLGGVALERAQISYPWHKVSWEFQAPASYESLAVFVPESDKEKVTIITYNLDQQSVAADMSVWEIKPGSWRIKQGVDTSGDQQFDTDITETLVYLERGKSVDLNFEPRAYTIIAMELIEPAETGYHERADLGIGPDDIRIQGNRLNVRIHSMGAINSPDSQVALMDRTGRVISTADVPELEAPVDLIPRWIDVVLEIPEDMDLKEMEIVIDSENQMEMITRANNRVALKKIIGK